MGNAQKHSVIQQLYATLSHSNSLTYGMSYNSIKHKGGTGDCSYLSLKFSEVALSITRSQRVYNGRRIIKYNVIVQM